MTSIPIAIVNVGILTLSLTILALSVERLNMDYTTLREINEDSHSHPCRVASIDQSLLLQSIGLAAEGPWANINNEKVVGQIARALCTPNPVRNCNMPPETASCIDITRYESLRVLFPTSSLAKFDDHDYERELYSNMCLSKENTPVTQHIFGDPVSRIARAYALAEPAFYM